MDLTNQRRRLICAGRLFRTGSTFERKGMYELFVLLFDNYRTGPLIFSSTGCQFKVLFCSRDNPDRRDRLGYHISSLQTSRAIKSLPSNNTDLDGWDSRSRLTFFGSRLTPIPQIEEDPSVGETVPLPFHQKPGVLLPLLETLAQCSP